MTSTPVQQDVKLLPCPFCGAKSVPAKITTATKFAGHVVLCSGCETRTALCADETRAVAAWNRRISPPTAASDAGLEPVAGIAPPPVGALVLIGLPPNALEHLKLVGLLQDNSVREANIELGAPASTDHPMVGNVDADDLEGLSDPARILVVLERRLERGALPIVVHFPHGFAVPVGVAEDAGNHRLYSHSVAPSVELGTIQATILKHTGIHLTNISFISTEILFSTPLVPLSVALSLTAERDQAVRERDVAIEHAKSLLAALKKERDERNAK